MSIFDSIEMLNNQIVNNKWVEWKHPDIPNEDSVVRTIIRILMAALGHCLICTKLDGCCFLERKMPEFPQHEKCDYLKEACSKSLLKIKASAQCDVRKFTDYIFKKNNGKKELFESWGYSINDSQSLKFEFEKQALEQYLNGNYELKGLDYNGQRIAIPINLNGNKFYSGWMVYPNGCIKNTTPFGGWIK